LIVTYLVGTNGGRLVATREQGEDTALRPVLVHDMWDRMTPGPAVCWVVRVSLSGGPGTLTLVIGAHTAHSRANCAGQATKIPLHFVFDEGTDSAAIAIAKTRNLNIC
jgi:hypothetical protein